MSEVVLEARELDAGYRGRAVVRGLNLSVHAGEMVGLFGSNGAGKTTALLTLAGHLPAVAGELSLFGRRHPRSLVGAAQRGVALLADDRGIFPPLSVRDNLRLGRGGVAGAVEFFPELREHLDRPAGLLSGGQQQMLSLGRLLAAEPRLILADELSLGLAPLIVRRLLAALRDAADAGAAVVLVEQHVPAALKVINRAVVLVRGELRLEAHADRLRSEPDLIRDLYIAG
jgi:branched-chain amino acid transport system ATP-binding protein